MKILQCSEGLRSQLNNLMLDISDGVGWTMLNTHQKKVNHSLQQLKLHSGLNTEQSNNHLDLTLDKQSTRVDIHTTIRLKISSKEL